MKHITNIWHPAHALFMCLMVMISLCAPATEDGDVTIVNVTGILLEPPACTLNEDETLRVPFGNNIGIKKIPSGIYRESIHLTIQCEEDSYGRQIQLSLNGVAADFDADNATIVTTEMSGLGVKIYADNTPLPLSTPLDISPNALPKLEAVLVQRGNEELATGVFTAFATLRVDYK